MEINNTQTTLFYQYMRLSPFSVRLKDMKCARC